MNIHSQHFVPKQNPTSSEKIGTLAAIEAHRAAEQAFAEFLSTVPEEDREGKAEWRKQEDELSDRTLDTIWETLETEPASIAEVAALFDYLAAVIDHSGGSLPDRSRNRDELRHNKTDELATIPFERDAFIWASRHLLRLKPQGASRQAPSCVRISSMSGMSANIPHLLDLESPLRDTWRLLLTAMQLFGDNMEPDVPLDEQLADLVWQVVRSAEEKQEQALKLWEALVDRQRLAIGA